MAANFDANGTWVAEAGDQPVRSRTPTASEPPLDDLMARLCHDLRTPLNAIIGFSEIIERELLGPLGSERYQSYATHIRQSGIDLLAAVETTLALTQQLAEARAPRS